MSELGQPPQRRELLAGAGDALDEQLGRSRGRRRRSSRRARGPRGRRARAAADRRARRSAARRARTAPRARGQRQRSARGARARGRRGATRQCAARCRSSASKANSSARTGTAISAAAVGVGARRSAAWSNSVVSVSWPTAEISGIGDSAAARTTSSSLNAHKSSIEPPPRATISRSGAAAADRGEAANGRRDLGGRALALDRHRPDDDTRRAAVLEPVEDVADHRAGRRGDHADHLRQERQRPLALGVEQALGGERPAAPFEQRHQRALAGQLHAAR